MFREGRGRILGEEDPQGDGKSMGQAEPSTSQPGPRVVVLLAW